MASKRLYVSMAETIKSHNTSTGIAILSDLVEDICKDLKADNPRFNHDKFVRACGFPDLADN